MKYNKKIESQISIPNGVKIEKKKQFLVFSGVLGFTLLDLTKIDPTGLGGIKIGEDEKKLCTVFFFSQSKTLFYSLKTLLKNKIRGVTVGFLVSLRIVGVGYRASLEKKKNEKIEETKEGVHTLLALPSGKYEKDVYNFKLGYSHKVKYQVPDSIRVFLLEPTFLGLFGIDKNQVSQVASKIRSFKVPERYKGKGIRFTTEKITLSQGKRK